MFFGEGGEGGCPTHCPAVQLLSQDNPCVVTAPGVQGMAWGGYLPSSQRCWGLGDARVPAAEDAEAAAFQASEVPASARVDSVMCSPSFSPNPSCSTVDAALLPPHPTVYAAECCSLRLLSEAPGRTRALGTRGEAARRYMGVKHPHSAAPQALTDN